MITEGYLTWQGHRTYYRAVGAPEGGKPPLLMLHGGPGSTHNYFEVLDRLAEEDGRQLISYDQLGCGNSYLDGHPELWNMETWQAELRAVREALCPGAVYLLGQSWGGMLLLEYICRHPHPGVRGVVLSSTLPSSRLWGEEQARLIRELPARMQEAIRSAAERNDYTDPEYQLAEEYYMLLHAGGPFGEDAPDCLTRPKRRGRESYLVGWGPNEFTPTGTLKDYDVTDLLLAIEVPALIISGENDLCTPNLAKYMYDRIPKARWELFPGCRHSCFVEDTARYAALLKQWLNDCDAADPAK